mmetsp:Transcript_111584/g.197717  ORF Transcript_111584/g.197717 Transcript_111584/m.197717 type:complete len:90 (-) Transcript_111584:999-1268(-)
MLRQPDTVYDSAECPLAVSRHNSNFTNRLGSSAWIPDIVGKRGHQHTCLVWTGKMTICPSASALLNPRGQPPFCHMGDTPQKNLLHPVV